MLLRSNARIEFGLQLRLLNIDDSSIAQGDLFGLQVDSFLRIGEQCEMILVAHGGQIVRFDHAENENGDAQLVHVDDEYTFAASALAGEQKRVGNAVDQNTSNREKEQKDFYCSTKVYLIPMSPL
jgi:hypothetical protein